MHRLESHNYLVQHNKQFHMKVPLNSIPPWDTMWHVRYINTLSFIHSFIHLNGPTFGFHSDLKGRTTLYSIINSITWKYCSIWKVTQLGFIPNLNFGTLLASNTGQNKTPLGQSDISLYLHTWRSKRTFLFCCFPKCGFSPPYFLCKCSRTRRVND